jgi:hypothetical protein
MLQQERCPKAGLQTPFVAVAAGALVLFRKIDPDDRLFLRLK